MGFVTNDNEKAAQAVHHCLSTVLLAAVPGTTKTGERIIWAGSVAARIITQTDANSVSNVRVQPTSRLPWLSTASDGWR